MNNVKYQLYRVVVLVKRTTWFCSQICHRFRLSNQL